MKYCPKVLCTAANSLPKLTKHKSKRHSLGNNSRKWSLKLYFQMILLIAVCLAEDIVLYDNRGHDITITLTTEGIFNFKTSTREDQYEWMRPEIEKHKITNETCISIFGQEHRYSGDTLLTQICGDEMTQLQEYYLKTCANGEKWLGWGESTTRIHESQYKKLHCFLAEIVEDQLIRTQEQISIEKHERSQEHISIEKHEELWTKTHGILWSLGYVLTSDKASSFIGKGAHAEVYKFYRKKQIFENMYTAEIDKEITYAVKLFKANLNETGEKAANTEIKGRQQMIKHKNIVRYEAAFQDTATGRYYVIMEYIKGDMFAFIENFFKSFNYPTGKVPAGFFGEWEETCSKVIREIAEGVKELHRLGIAHCDLKPENILIDADLGVVKIADFGASSEINSEPPLCMTQSRTSPEVIRGESKKCGLAPNDAWALATITYQALFNENPFDFRERTELFIERGFAHPKSAKGTGQYEKLDTMKRIRVVGLPQDALYGISDDGSEVRIVSLECIDFILGLFVEDPTKRMTISEALAHPWLNKGEEKSKLRISRDELRKWYPYRKVKSSTR